MTRLAQRSIPWLPFRRLIPWLIFLLPGLLGSIGCGVNSFDPCQRLAYRICGCERTQSQQRTCERDRIQTQRDAITPTSAEADVCSQALDTCTCEDLDRNRTDLCGFTRTDVSEDDEPLIPSTAEPA